MHVAHAEREGKVDGRHFRRGSRRWRGRSSSRCFHSFVITLTALIFLGQRRLRIHIAEDNRHAVLATADDDDLRIGRLSELKSRLNTAPTQVRIRDPLTDELLEVTDAFSLDLLALRLFSFAHHAKYILQM